MIFDITVSDECDTIFVYGVNPEGKLQDFKVYGREENKRRYRMADAVRSIIGLAESQIRKMEERGA